MGSGTLPGGFTFDSDIIPAFQKDSPRNDGRVDDPALETILNQWTAALTPEQQHAAASKASQQITDNVDHLWYGAAQGIVVAQPWLHGAMVCNHSCFHGYGGGNYKYLWLGENAPGGRGGKRT